jgi:hypothetical protein
VPQSTQTHWISIRARAGDRRESSEAGFALATQLVAISVATVGLLGAIATACVGVLTAERAAERVDARLAALALLDSRALDATPEGGSIAPDAPVDGYFDVVVASEKSGGYEVVPAGASVEGDLFRRQWRVRSDEATGARLVEVSCELMASVDGGPMRGAAATRVILSKARFS